MVSYRINYELVPFVVFKCDGTDDILIIYAILRFHLYCGEVIYIHLINHARFPLIDVFINEGHLLIYLLLQLIHQHQYVQFYNFHRFLEYIT